MIELPRRNLLAFLACAPVIVRASSLMAINSAAVRELIPLSHFGHTFPGTVHLL